MKTQKHTNHEIVVDNIKTITTKWYGEIIQLSDSVMTQNSIYDILDIIQVTCSQINLHLLKLMQRTCDQNNQNDPKPINEKHNIVTVVTKKKIRKHHQDKSDSKITQFFNRLSQAQDNQQHLINKDNIHEIGTRWLNKLKEQLSGQEWIIDMITNKAGFLTHYYRQHIVSICGQEPTSRTQVSRFIKKLKNHDYNQQPVIQLDVNEQKSIRDIAYHDMDICDNYYPLNQSPIISELQQRYYTYSNGLSLITNSQRQDVFQQNSISGFKNRKPTFNPDITPFVNCNKENYL